MPWARTQSGLELCRSVAAKRSQRSAASLSPEVRSAIRQIDLQLAMSALLLASVGLFGVVSAAMTRRRHELAVRLALGADHGGLLRLILGEGMRLVLLGIVIGLPGAWFAGRLVRGIMVGVSPSDPSALSGVAAGLVLVTVVACYFPARRVLGIEPSRSMRDDSA